MANLPDLPVSVIEEDAVKTVSFFAEDMHNMLVVAYNIIQKHGSIKKEHKYTSHLQRFLLTGEMTDSAHAYIRSHK